MSRYYRTILNVQSTAIDPDAQAFLTAAGITDSTQISAVDTLVTDLKAQGLWTKMKAIYPFVGGTANAHKFNLKDPRDLDASYRLTFVGSPTHDSNGVNFNGTSQYVRTHFIPNNIGVVLGLFFYTRDNTKTGIDEVDFGVITDGNTRNLFIASSYRLGGIDRLLGRNTDQSVLLDAGANANASGFYGISKVGTTTDLYKESTSLVTATDTGLLPTKEAFINAFNSDGTPNFFGGRGKSFVAITEGLTGAEVTNLRNINLTFQTTLGRNV